MSTHGACLPLSGQSHLNPDAHCVLSDRYKRPRPVRKVPVALQAIRVAAQQMTHHAPRKAASKAM